MLSAPARRTTRGSVIPILNLQIDTTLRQSVHAGFYPHNVCRDEDWNKLLAGKSTCSLNSNHNITRLHPQGKGGPEGDFLCAKNTLNIYHTYNDMTISKSFNYNIDLA